MKANLLKLWGKDRVFLNIREVSYLLMNRNKKVATGGDGVGAVSGSNFNLPVIS